MQHVIERERKGDYLGKTVQVVPHITDAIQDWIEEVAKVPVDGKEGSPDVCVIELGGTVGDIESSPFVEALRQAVCPDHGTSLQTSSRTPAGLLLPENTLPFKMPCTHGSFALWNCLAPGNALSVTSVQLLLTLYSCLMDSIVAPFGGLLQADMHPQQPYLH